MTWWPCSICGCSYACEHREPELRMWVMQTRPADVMHAIEAAREIPRKPPERESASQQFDLFVEGRGRWAL